MDIFTHIISGFFLLGIVHWQASPLLFVYSSLMSSVPDLDVFLTPLQKLTGFYYLSHRGASHSLILAPLFAFIGALIFQFGIDLPFLQLWLFGFCGICLHLLLDISTVSTIPLLFPFSKKEFCLYIERSVNFYVLIVSFVLIFINIIWINWIHPKFPQVPIEIVPTVLIILYMSYFVHRIVIRIVVGVKLKPTQIFLPDLVPFAWGIYEKSQQDSKQIYRLTAHSVWFRSNFPEYQVNIQMQSEDQQYINRALQILRQFRFFRKWRGILPRIIHDEINIVVLLGLAEGFSRDHQYYGKVVFNRDTNQIIDYSESFRQVHSNFFTELPSK